MALRCVARYDVVICAGGRQALSQQWRAERGLTTRLGDTQTALILKFTGAPPGETTQAGESALTRSIGGSGRVYVRPGAVPGEGWAWLLGVPEKQTTRLAAALSVGRSSHASFAACLAAARAVDVSPEALAAAQAEAQAEKAKAEGGNGSKVDPMVAAKEATNAIVARAKAAAAAAGNAVAAEQKAAASKEAAAKLAAKAKAKNGGKTPPPKKKRVEVDWVAEARNQFIIFHRDLLENTSLDVAACFILCILLTCALLMTSSHSEGHAWTGCNAASRGGVR